MTDEEMTWEEFDDACRQIAQWMKPLHLRNIYGIPRGGLVVAVRLSHLTNLPLLLEEHEIRYDTLIVDDICDSGNTLRRWAGFHTAVLYKWTESAGVPGFWIYEKQKRWIVFPWERP